MQSAIVQGFYDISTGAIFSCPGACAWNGSYVSLGVKSECKDVTNATLRSRKCNKRPNSGGFVACNMTTPGGLGISTRNMFGGWATIYWMNASSTFKDVFSTEIAPDFPKFSRFAIYRSTSDANFNSYNINITDCSLSFTAYRYTGAQANGSTFSFNEIEEVKFSAQNWNVDMNMEKAVIFTNESKADNIPALRVSYGDYIALQTFLESGTIMSETEVLDGEVLNQNPGLSAVLGGDVDIGARFQKLAASMTDYIRSGPNGRLARGERLESESFVFIRWRYLIGPAAIELTALVFAAVTIYLNRKSHKVPLWKSSALAVLNCQYKKQSSSIQAEVKDIREIKKTAKKAVAKLE